MHRGGIPLSSNESNFLRESSPLRFFMAIVSLIDITSLLFLSFPLAGAFVVFFDTIVFVVVELVVAKVVV